MALCTFDPITLLLSLLENAKFLAYGHITCGGRGARRR